MSARRRGVMSSRTSSSGMRRPARYIEAKYPVSERLLTLAELADRLALSTSTVLDWFEAGRLPGFKLGRVVRFRESEVLAWLEAHRVGPGAAGEVAPVPYKSPDPRRSLTGAPVPVTAGGQDAS